MKLAQQEIKATMTVNTSDLGSKKKDEEPPDKDVTARKKGEGSVLFNKNIVKIYIESYSEWISTDIFHEEGCNWYSQ